MDDHMAADLLAELNRIALTLELIALLQFSGLGGNVDGDLIEQRIRELKQARE